MTVCIQDLHQFCMSVCTVQQTGGLWPGSSEPEEDCLLSVCTSVWLAYLQAKQTST